MLKFEILLLSKPARTGSNQSLTIIIKRRVLHFLAGTVIDAPGRKIKHVTSDDPNSNLSSIIASKIEDGNVRAALRILFSNNQPTEDYKQTFVKLLERHSVTPATRNLIPAVIPNDPCLQVSEQGVMSAIQSFPAGSAGGSDGVRQ